MADSYIEVPQRPRRRGPKPGPEGVRGGIMGFRPTAAERSAVRTAAGEEGVAGWLRRLARLAAGMDETGSGRGR